MRHWTRVLLSVVSCLVFLIPAQSAFAAAPSLTLCGATGHPLSVRRVIGWHFGPSEPVTLSFDTTTLKTVTTSRDHYFETFVTIPDFAQPGTHILHAIGTVSRRSANISFLVQTDWPMDGFNAEHTHFNPFENTLNTSNAVSLSRGWSKEIGGVGTIEPAIVDGRVYFSSTNGHLSAYNATTGKQIWRRRFPVEPFTSPAVDNGMLFIGSSDNQLYAIKAKTGATVWRGTTGAAIFNSPVIAKDVVYVTSSDDKLYAFAASTGLLLWNVSLGTNTHVFSPLVANGIVFTASSSTISAFNALTGTAIWSTPTDLFAVSTPVESDGVVYVTTGNGSGYNEVRGFDAKSGDLIWKFAANYISSPPSIVKQTLYVGGVDELFSININTRELNWNDAVVSGDVNSAPTIANGVVYANAGETTYAIDASSGTNLWSDKLNPNAILQSSPVVVNGFVYIGTINGLYTFHLS